MVGRADTFNPIRLGGKRAVFLRERFFFFWDVDIFQIQTRWFMCVFFGSQFLVVFQKAWVSKEGGNPRKHLPFSYIFETRQHFTCHLRFIWQERLKFLRLMGGQKFVDAATSMVPRLQFGSQWRRCQKLSYVFFGSVRIRTKNFVPKFW